MKKLFYILALFTGIANAQIVNIPDPEFKALLVASIVNANDDGEIQLSEALDTASLTISGLGIDDLTGIEAFTNMTELICRDTSITALDITMLPSINNLTCNDNDLLTSVNVSNMPNLGYLLP